MQRLSSSVLLEDSQCSCKCTWTRPALTPHSFTWSRSAFTPHKAHSPRKHSRPFDVNRQAASSPPAAERMPTAPLQEPASGEQELGGTSSPGVCTDASEMRPNPCTSGQVLTDLGRDILKSAHLQTEAGVHWTDWQPRYQTPAMSELRPYTGEGDTCISATIMIFISVTIESQTTIWLT